MQASCLLVSGRVGWKFGKSNHQNFLPFPMQNQMLVSLEEFFQLIWILRLRCWPSYHGLCGLQCSMVGEGCGRKTTRFFRKQKMDGSRKGYVFCTLRIHENLKSLVVGTEDPLRSPMMPIPSAGIQAPSSDGHLHCPWGMGPSSAAVKVNFETNWVEIKGGW